MIGNCHGEVISGNRDMTLTAVYDTRHDASEKLAEKWKCRAAGSMEELFSMVDAVAVCLPSDMHAQAVVQSARAGKHVICEKPVAARVEDAEEMIRCCRENGVLFSVVFQHRFDTAVQAARQAIERGDLGRILWASSRSILYREENYFTNTPWHAKFGSGALMNQSIHYIDLLLYLLGDPVAVQGHCGARLHVKNETEDVGLAIAEFADGAPAVIEGTTAAYPGLYNELSLYGENGSFIIRNDELFSYKLKSGNRREYDAILNPYAVYTAYRDTKIDLSSHRKQYANVADAILGRDKLAISGEEGIRSLKLIQAIYESSEKGQKIHLK